MAKRREGEEKHPVRELTKWLGQLQEERRTFEPFWKDVQDYIVPHRGRYLSGDSPSEANNGERRDRKIIRGAATKALETMASGMQSGLTSKAREWFNLGHPDRNLNRRPDVVAYYRAVKTALMESFDRSNLYNALFDLYSEMGSFGTGAMAILPHPDKVFFFRTYTAGSYYLSANNRQEVDAFFVFEYMTVRQMAAEYGVNRLSEEARRLYESGQVESRIKVNVAVLRNGERVGIRSLGSDMPVVEVHWEESTPEHATQRKLLAVRGFRSFPVVTPRWSTVGEDVYGWSPTRTILGDAKMLQMMERDKLQGLAKLTNPPLQGPPELERMGINASPGGYNAVSPTGGGEGVRPLYMVSPDVNSINAAINQVIYDIQKGFYNDLFMMLQQRDMINSSQMTAREVDERSWEKMLSLGPVLERIHYEGLNPLIDRCVQMLAFAGRLPDPPPELLGSPSKVEYISILSQAQKAVAVKRNESMIGYVGSIVGVFPEARRKVNIEKAIEDYAEHIGVNPEIIVGGEEYQQLVAADAQTQAMAQQAQIGGELAAGAKVASEIDQTNMGEILANLTGTGSGRMVV